ncbi:thiopeptide-type bacteriocin biosynthesis protein [Acinetobacter baumannii]|uniref:thiopeptide-type bacteriocin biosynthesis protein n=1 Tax=Acinetobacter baumannii TaxID=470 RepID=UPI00234044D5|nr:thiopeptide-type bacteriocin biosynthesis protein [Acinetobacter baumannii]MDC4919647.1 thiopeptide-type bacteriocin biosynthesis protein [Acinetobacter baumannii]MDC4934123.1 thiopeptide-type bacteriocin biosynthesis protein [Acinetobacter baumannii]MDC5521379.1 thiopeptide-type bacteriocin biosynthesis protein [Acinetobacter baumannii]
MHYLQEWTYFKLYVGDRYDALDWIITDVIGDALNKVGDLPWFYLRYIDEKGTHLRFRVKLPQEQKNLDKQLYACLHDNLSAIGILPFNQYTPLISVVGQNNTFDDRNVDLGIFCEKSIYEPELEKYGGEKGIVIAEKLFHKSSEIAREILIQEKTFSLNRKDFVLLLFICGLDVFLKKQNIQPFLERYATFWLSGNPAIGSLKMVFSEQAYELLDTGANIIPEILNFELKNQELIKDWYSALKEAREAYSLNANNYSSDMAERLAFHFIHLMNNRLGFNSLEESYLATLLSRIGEMGYNFELV